MSSENDSVSPPLNIEKCSLVLVDVAGTTTSINFVKDTLFPFVVKQAGDFIKAKWDDEIVKESVKQLKDGDLDVVAAVELVKSLTEENSPNQGLKTLQGLIYKEGYEKGDLKAHIFDDVPGTFETWAKSRHIAIYSTGSVESQKLLFAHTISGDISAHIHKYYDQTIGPKTEAESYKKIAEDSKIEPSEIVFITDDVNEATAAKSGGVHAVLISREGNPAFSDDVTKQFTIVSSFNDLVLDKASKRKIDEEPTSSEAPPSKVPKTDPTEETKVEEKTKTEEKLEKIEEESMEVDTPTEKPAEKAEETKTATEETEKLVENEPEKTEKEITKEIVEVETKEATCTDTEMKDVEKTEKEAKEEPQMAKEETKATADDSQTAKEETKVITEDAKAAKEETKETAEDSQTAKEETKVTTEDAKTAKEETKQAGEESQSAEKKAEAEETKPEKTVAVVEEKTKSEVEETKPAAVEESAKAESKPKETKTEPEKTEEKVEVAKENGEAKPEEATAETSAPKAEEKENKSVLANGVENGTKEESGDKTENKESETAEVKNDDVEKDDEPEVKVKKLEESAESKTVSVEV